MMNKVGFVLGGTTWRAGCLALAAASLGANKRMLSSRVWGEGSSTMLLQQRVNRVTGECEWVVVSDQNEDEGESIQDEAVRNTLVGSSYLDMLNDHPRNRAFHAAIRKLAKDLSSSSSCSHVLDIGAGTGLLSMMVYRAMRARNAESDLVVTACESYLPMYRLARRILKQNGLDSDKIKLLHMRSDEIKVGVDMPSRADALVSEILDSELLGEGVIPSLRHAHQHLLKPNPRTVPYRATMYAQFVECEFLWRSHDLRGVEEQLQDGLVLAPDDFSSCFKYSQYALHVDELPNLQQLSEPFQTFSLDFYKCPDARGQLKLNAELSRSGTAHAIVSWWVLQLDEEGLINYSTAPDWIKNGTSGRAWSDHWKQCVWFIPGRGIPVQEKSRLDVTINHDETSVWYEVGNQSIFRNENRSESGFKMMPDRIRMLGDPTRRSILRSAVEKALRGRNSATCLVLDDSLLAAVCSLSAATDDSRVFAISPGFKYLSNLGAGKLRLLRKEVKQLTSDDFEGKKVDVLLAEPYYSTYEHMLPWKQLRFWHERTLVAPLLSENPVIVPCRGVLYGMAYSLPDLWHSRCKLDNVEGFDHRAANFTIGACGNLPDGVESPILAFHTWQCGEQESLTEPFALMDFNLNDEIAGGSGCAKVSFQKSGICHAIVLWMDWTMELESNLVISTGPSVMPSWKQGVKLLTTPIHALENEVLQVEVNFDTTGELVVSITS